MDRNAIIEECAGALEREAGHNDAVAKDDNDFLAVRLRAEQSASVKRYCAGVLRAMKSD